MSVRLPSETLGYAFGTPDDGPARARWPMLGRMKALVLGATGTVGQPLVSNLLSRGVAVRAATRDPAKAELPPGAEAVRFDASDPGTFAPALDGVDRAFVLAPPGHADQHALLAPFVEAAGPRLDKIVVMTAQGVEVSDSIPFRQLELAVASAAKAQVVLRPTWFDQNFTSFWWPPIAAGGVIPLPAGAARTAFIDAEDIAAVAAKVLVEDRFDGRALELTGPEALDYAEAAAILSQAWDRPIRYEEVSEDSFRAYLSQGGLPDDYADLLVGLFGAVRAGRAAVVTKDVPEVLGRPARSLKGWAEESAPR